MLAGESKVDARGQAEVRGYCDEELHREIFKTRGLQFVRAWS